MLCMAHNTWAGSFICAIVPMRMNECLPSCMPDYLTELNSVIYSRWVIKYPIINLR